jgi:polyhydroxyalkanoate synthesis regulator protein
MNKIGRKIFYDIITGDVITDTGERQGAVTATTIEQDIETFKTLKERVRETFDVIELPFGAYAQDFSECNGYRVNPETKQLDFSYPDPNEPDAPQSYQAPLSEEVKTLKTQLQTTQEAVDFLLMGGM